MKVVLWFIEIIRWSIQGNIQFQIQQLNFKRFQKVLRTLNFLECIFLAPKADGTLDTLVAKTSFDVQKMESIMAEVYSTVNFVNPSPYTPISFTPDARFTKDWKRDSVVYMYGNGNKDRIVMFMRVDPTPSPVRALFVPLYIGRMYTFDNAPRKNTVIIGGCRNGDQYNYAPNKKNWKCKFRLRRKYR